MFSAKEISDYVDANKEECLRCFQEIIRTPSVTGDEEAVSYVFEKWMTDNGLKVTRHEMEPHHPNLLAEWFGSQPGKRFVFNGHMDVFPPDPNDPGTYGPWSGEIVDGWLYGRGSTDMKGGDVGVLMATILLKRMGFDPKGSVLLSWMCDEENGGRLGVQYMLKEGLLNGDFGICPEPTDTNLVYQHGGILRGTVTYHGVPQHTGIPYEFGENALQKAMRAIDALNKINDRLSKIHVEGLPPPCFTVSVLNAGEVANVHPSKAVFWYDRRLVPGENHEDALAEIVGILDDLKAKDPSYVYELEVTSKRPLLEIPEDEPYLKTLVECFREIMGRDPIVRKSPGGSDASWIQKTTGMPIPLFSAAEGWSQMGKADEKIELKPWFEMIKVYMLVLVRTLS